MENKKQFLKKHLIESLLILLIFIILAFFSIQKLASNWDWLTLRPQQELNVPLENQYPDLPNGCEVTSLSMLLNYYGYKTNKDKLASEIAHVDSFTNNGKYRGNPNEGFVGYMNIANAGWCVYNKPLYNVARKYTKKVRNYTGHSFLQVMKLVSKGHPVLIITTTKFNKVSDMQTWQTNEGKVNVTPSSHACVITGYNKKKKLVYVNDPFGTKNKKISWNNLEASYNQQGKQSIYIQ
ncbi:C39 family peptidase [Lactobacillus sp.]|uniref:C39 family peptidase n=1 Tax=Lactobacillus sp. TaxID=1591 RepID=UPI0019864A21|nr:C39 family peptidase [Lactobacillus sp.]MBD5430097.1 C39 family peptidase [Lactobacillus sp.]MBD5430577.1 C39 family peptidase [Lactobacillus sp.]